MQTSSQLTTFLFTDIEGSTRLWEQDPERMRPALARHDALARSAVESNAGVVVKMTGDGVHAAFDDPLAAVVASIEFQQRLVELAAASGTNLNVRCGINVGADERRDNDFFGTAVNRAARLMSAAHGGQILLSLAVAALVANRLPEGVALIDLGSLRLRDMGESEHVFQVAHPALRREFPPLRSLEATPNNLPLQLTSFVGREREVSDVKAMLRDARLVTLIGMGGLGKTRLSLEVAAQMLADYADGVWFVDLAPLRDPQLVAQAVASVIGIKEEAGRPVREALLKFVTGRHLLLILDNCEHLLDACAELATQLLAQGRGLTVLATSREYLRARGETSYPVAGMSIPVAGKPLSPQVMMQCEAVRLFVDRAMAARPAFALTAQHAPAVADICRRLDGVPLALELAAARVRTLTVQRIAQGLDERFRWLNSGHRTDLPRQQTLRALIDWSYDLLTPAEQQLFRRLAVFAGGFSLDAAEAVAGAPDLAMAELPDLVTALVEKSLVVFEPERDRYRLLETVREYAHERLLEADDEAATRTRHLGHYLGVLEAAKPELVGPDQGMWLALLDLERENILHAHGWCDRAANGAELDVQLAALMKLYWINRGLLNLGHRVTVEAMNRAGDPPRGASRLRALFDAGQLCFFMGRYDEAHTHLDESLAIARSIGDVRRIAAVLQPLGMAALGRGDLPKARGCLEEAQALALQRGDKRECAAAANALAQLHRATGDLDRAEPLYRDVLAMARELDDRESIAIGLLNIAMVAIARGQLTAARDMLAEVMRIIDEIHSRAAGQSAFEVLAGLAAAAGEWVQAARFFGVAQAQAGETGMHRDPADDAFLKPLMATARGALGEKLFAVNEAVGRALAPDDAVIEVRHWLARAENTTE